jgi:hypothetical protein
MPRKNHVANGRIALRAKHFALKRRESTVVYSTADHGGGSGRLATRPHPEAAERRHASNSLRPEAGSALARAWS